MSEPNVFLMAEFDRQCLYFQVTSEISKAINKVMNDDNIIGRPMDNETLRLAGQAVAQTLQRFFIPSHIKVELTRDIEDRSKLNLIFLDERPCDNRQYTKDLLGSMSGIKRR